MSMGMLEAVAIREAERANPPERYRAVEIRRSEHFIDRYVMRTRDGKRLSTHSSLEIAQARAAAENRRCARDGFDGEDEGRERSRFHNSLAARLSARDEIRVAREELPGLAPLPMPEGHTCDGKPLPRGSCKACEKRRPVKTPRMLAKPKVLEALEREFLALRKT